MKQNGEKLEGGERNMGERENKTRVEEGFNKNTNNFGESDGISNISKSHASHGPASSMDYPIKSLSGKTSVDVLSACVLNGQDTGGVGGLKMVITILGDKCNNVQNVNLRETSLRKFVKTGLFTLIRLINNATEKGGESRRNIDKIIDPDILEWVQISQNKRIYNCGKAVLPPLNPEPNWD